MPVLIDIGGAGVGIDPADPLGWMDSPDEEDR
jgi:hypothetical protein